MSIILHIVGTILLSLFSFILGIFIARNEILLKDAVKLREEMEELELELLGNGIEVPKKLLH